MRALADPHLPSGVCIRPARPEDQTFFFEARRAGFKAYAEEIWGWDDERHRRFAARDLGELPIEIIEEDGVPMGYLCVIHHEDHDFIDELAIVPAARRRGIGSALVQGIMQAASDRGVPVRLSVLVNNPARSLYEHLGFRVTRVEHPRVKMQWLRDEGLRLDP